MAKKKQSPIRKLFLVLMISFFILSGLVAASYVLFGSDNDIYWKLLGTMGTLLLGSVFGFVSARNLDEKDFRKMLGIVGITFTLIAVVLIIPIIWGMFDINDSLGKIILTSGVVAFAVSHFYFDIWKEKY